MSKPVTLEQYAKHLAKQYPIYKQYEYQGKNGADSANKKAIGEVWLTLC